jgi:hypothetical protein
MLIELYGENFGCFRDEFVLSMLATDVDPGEDRGIIGVNIEGDSQPLRLLRAVGIYGPNASGKSTVLRAARALDYLIERSARFASDEQLGPYEPFLLAPDRSDRPVRLGVKAVIETGVYDYQIAFDSERFVSERLARLLPEGTQRVLVDRREQEVAGEWASHERFALIAEDFRPNALLLSLTDQLAPKIAGDIARGLRRLLSSDSLAFRTYPAVGSARLAEKVESDREFRSWLLAQLKAADIGVVDVVTYETQEPRAPASTEPVGDADVTDEEDAARRFVKVRRISLVHAGTGDQVAMPMARESYGTRMLLALAPALYELYHSSQPRGTFVDEIAESLHPVLLRELIRHFNCELAMDQVRGQMIFATHDTLLMDAEAREAVLRRDQVYFTEKGDDGAARLYSLAEFRERQNVNPRRRYLQGRYGAIPAVGPFAE